MSRSRFFIQSLGMGLVIGAAQPVAADEVVQFAQAGPAQRADQAHSPADPEREEMKARRQAERERRATLRSATPPEGVDRRQFRQEMRAARERVYGPPKRRDDR